ncbi:phosphotransferase family [Fusarium pseudoanthophilum]|uniref:Phosphotransferase family n=1 Tax=Fusarium pseudoanthophilum TaxID=48495 RepID=A0A8H5PP94_9HYPO|nr:phosphotransferase family [Fusarium pseudoanthophilum]
MQTLPPTILVDSLPTGSSVTFLGSSFFTSNGSETILPSADQVRAKSEAGDHVLNRKNTVIFESLGLVVKFGKEPRVTVAEGQCLWWLRRHLPSVPVPEIYGWTEDEGECFLYMQLVEGLTLEERWDSLSREDKVGVCEQLRDMVIELRRVKRDPEDEFLGQINRGPLQDVVFADGIRPRAGPFPSVKEFHNWFSFLIRRQAASGPHWEGYELEDIPDLYRQLLPDDPGVVFTHADLHQSNIMVSEGSPCLVVAVIDWHQSGWYPDYWEFYKAVYTNHWESKWVQEYIPMFLEEPRESFIDGIDNYARSWGFM